MAKAPQRKSLSRRVPTTSTRRRTRPSTFTMIVVGIMVVGTLAVLASRDDDGPGDVPDVASTVSTIPGDTTTVPDVAGTVTTVDGTTDTSSAAPDGGASTTAGTSTTDPTTDATTAPTTASSG
jgi:hypothetical protein